MTWSPPWSGRPFGFGPRAEHSKVIYGKDLSLFFHDAYGNRIDAGTEFFSILALDKAFKPVFLKVLAEGDKGAVTVYPRDIIDAASRPGAHWIVLMHNHPSGQTAPSSEDEHLTSAVDGFLVQRTDARLWDHIITTRDPERFHSFRKAFLAKSPKGSPFTKHAAQKAA